MPPSNTATTTRTNSAASSDVISKNKNHGQQSVVTVAAAAHHHNASSSIAATTTMTPPSITGTTRAKSVPLAFGCGGKKKTKRHAPQEHSQQQRAVIDVDERKQQAHHHHRPRPMIGYIPLYLQRYVAPYYGDYCYSRCFDARLLAQLMVEGFLPIATPYNVSSSSSSQQRGGGGGGGDDNTYILLPKLHEQRCVIPLQQYHHHHHHHHQTTASDSSSSSSTPAASTIANTTKNHLHISKSVRKKSKHFFISINQAFDQVVQACQEQHGHHCWLYPPLVQAFEMLHRAAMPASIQSATSTIPWPSLSLQNSQQQSTCPVRVYSIEVWSTDDASCTDPSYLVAGELGYTIGQGCSSPDTTTAAAATTTGTTAAGSGGIYTSLTGFSRQDSAGSVQMAALGQMLVHAGFALWDLGMDMNYKQELGAILMERDDFVKNVHLLRNMNNNKTSTSAGTTTNEMSKKNAAPSSSFTFDTCAVRRNCRNVIDGNVSTSTTSSASAAAPSPSLLSKKSTK